MAKAKQKKESFKCPNCGATKEIPVYRDTTVIKDQHKCADCGYVVTEE